jgi:hypothetical protein
MTDPECIAAGLSEAQRRVLRSGDQFNVRYCDMRVIPALNKKGLMVRANCGVAMSLSGDHVHLNHLGAQVRAILMKEDE